MVPIRGRNTEVLAGKEFASSKLATAPHGAPVITSQELYGHPSYCRGKGETKMVLKSGFRSYNTFSHEYEMCISTSQRAPQPSDPGWCLSSWYSYLPNNNPKEHSLPGYLPDRMQPLCPFCLLFFFFFSFLNFVRHGNIDSKKFSLFCETDWLRLLCCCGKHDLGAGEGRQRGKLVYFAFTCALFSPLAGNSEKDSDPAAVSCVGSDCISSTCLMWVLF